MLTILKLHNPPDTTVDTKTTYRWFCLKHSTRFDHFDSKLNNPARFLVFWLKIEKVRFFLPKSLMKPTVKAHKISGYSDNFHFNNENLSCNNFPNLVSKLSNPLMHSKISSNSLCRKLSYQLLSEYVQKFILFTFETKPLHIFMDFAPHKIEYWFLRAGLTWMCFFFQIEFET